MAELNKDEHAPIRVRLLAEQTPPILELGGELDLSTVEAVRPIVDQLVARRTDRVIVDLAALRFMDSSGIALLLSLAGSVTNLEVRNPSPIIEQIIEMTGLSGTLVITA
jgi:anti-sigma B factor antagonist